MGFALFCAACAWWVHGLCMRRRGRRRDADANDRLRAQIRQTAQLQDTALQGLQGMLYYLQAIRQRLPGRTEEGIQLLDQAMARGELLLSEARRAMPLLDPATVIGGADLVDAMCTLLEDLPDRRADQQPTTLRLAAEGPVVALESLVRDEALRITHEAVNNAQQHAGARNIDVEVRFGSRTLQVVVRDDGVGLDEAMQRQASRLGGRGIRDMCERALSIGAKLEVWSRRGAGTEVRLSIPTIGGAG